MSDPRSPSRRAGHVTAIKPKAGPADRTVTLPGTLMGYTESPIYARSTGYIAHWYRDGLANYLDVIDAQQALLTQRRLNTSIRGEQLAQSVFLIKALGGGWSASPNAGNQLAETRK